MLSVCELRDKGKWPYTENTSARISGYPSSGRYKIKIKVMICVTCLDSREWKCMLIFFDNLLYTCGYSGLTERDDLLSK